MGHVHQMQMSFSVVEDRLFFRFNTTDKNEFRFWFTRRYVKLLWSVLEKLLLNQIQSSLPITNNAQKALLSFQHEQVVAQSDFSKQYEHENMKTPLGEMPILLSRFQIKMANNGDSILCFHPEKGNGIEMNVDEKLLHSFAKILISSLSKTGWDLEYRIMEEQVFPLDNLRLN